ncbi:MAG TPA: hypothetical protein VNG73_07625 [Gemmatimonadaceae bacterium]|nr:hypothetical protein [Candidatus Limnocylindrales bacterium]HXI98798.1 hypothetical protein [Gemmatimonadaceae bacterium]
MSDLNQLLFEARLGRRRMEILQACNEALLKVIEARTTLGLDEWNKLRKVILARIDEVKAALEQS